MPTLFSPTPAPLAVALAVLLVVGAPLLEELVFRSGLQEQLLRTRVPPAAANACTAAAFTLAHGLTRSWWLAAGVVAPACALGWLYQRKRCVAPCVAAHAAMNLVWIGVSVAATAIVGDPR